MEWMKFSDAKAFAERTEPFLYEREDKNSLFLGVLEQIQNGQYEDYYLATVEQEGTLAAACLMTPPYPMQIVEFEKLDDGSEFIADQLYKEGISLNGVIGDRSVLDEFSAAWAARTGSQVRVQMNQGLYRLDEVNPSLEKSLGSWRVAGKHDAALLEDWYLQFEQDTGLSVSTEAEAADRIASFLEAKEVYVWEVNGKVVSCLKKSRPSKRGITISFVFTPKEHRKKGYARTLVAEVAEELLESYDFCMLYTDLLNPTSNKIYQEIGFRQIANPVHLSFDKTG